MILYDKLELCVSCYPCPTPDCPGFEWGIAVWVEGDWRLLLNVCEFRFPQPNWRESLEKEIVKVTGYTPAEFREAFG